MLKHFDREKLVWNSTLKPHERLVLLCLNSFVDANGECFPGIDTIAKQTGHSRSSVIRIIKDLAEKKIITKDVRRRNGKRTSNKYLIDFLVIPQNATLQNATLQNETKSKEKPETQYTSVLESMSQNATLQNATLQNETQPMSQNETQGQRENAGLSDLLCLKMKPDLSSINSLTTQKYDLSREEDKGDFSKKEKSEPTEPSNQSSPVNPRIEAETMSQVKPTGHDRYSAARNFLPEEIKNNSTLRNDLIYKTGGYRYPELIAAGLEAIWIGPGYTDFDQGVIAAAQQYLKTIEKPSEKGHALTYLKNLLFQNDWLKLEDLLRTSKERASKQAAPPSAAPTPVSAAPRQLSPEELEKRTKGIETMRSRYKNGAA